MLLEKEFSVRRTCDTIEKRNGGNMHAVAVTIPGIAKVR
jgi:hypothetical protein